jgi:hypothetical protein
MPKKSNNDKKKEAAAAGKSASYCPPSAHTSRAHAPSVRHPLARCTAPLTRCPRCPCAEPKMTKQQEKAGRGGNAKKEAMKAKRAAKKDDGKGW